MVLNGYEWLLMLVNVYMLIQPTKIRGTPKYCRPPIKNPKKRQRFSNQSWLVLCGVEVRRSEHLFRRWNWNPSSKYEKKSTYPGHPWSSMGGGFNFKNHRGVPEFIDVFFGKWKWWKGTDSLLRLNTKASLILLWLQLHFLDLPSHLLT